MVPCVFRGVPEKEAFSNVTRPNLRIWGSVSVLISLSPVQVNIFFKQKGYVGVRSILFYLQAQNSACLRACQGWQHIQMIFFLYLATLEGSLSGICGFYSVITWLRMVLKSTVTDDSCLCCYKDTI